MPHDAQKESTAGTGIPAVTPKEPRGPPCPGICVAALRLLGRCLVRGAPGEAQRIEPRTPAGPRFTPRELPEGGDVAAHVARGVSAAGLRFQARVTAGQRQAYVWLRMNEIPQQPVAGCADGARVRLVGRNSQGGGVLPVAALDVSDVGEPFFQEQADWRPRIIERCGE